ncbi:hypothetical protein GYMLUDRAFT_50791 [Collybiopsis luxurians FD-317 M1]|uniref:Uncharacterized protein n=1 Tax=Collybiopsis luxurians FD-317 M1 TaxID=944289 RepID=A0A0D0ALJ9_9AGAR|nr:hypothetical protein GYMLUDRAFT_50791 [Collybiopsis luxurians FD-317 M1]
MKVRVPLKQPLVAEVYPPRTRVLPAEMQAHLPATRVHSLATQVGPLATRAHSPATQTYSTAMQIHSPAMRVHPLANQVQPLRMQHPSLSALRWLHERQTRSSFPVSHLAEFEQVEVDSAESRQS